MGWTKTHRRTLETGGVRADVIGPQPRELFSETDDNSVAILLTYVTARVLLAVPEGELAEVAALVVREMENAVELSVPLKVEVKSGRSWGEMRPLGDVLVG